MNAEKIYPRTNDHQTVYLKNVITRNNIHVGDYTFYNDFYCDLMNALESKKEELLKYGEISLFKQECTALTVVDQSREAFHFVRIFIRKLKKLFKLNRRAINDYNENGQRN